MCYGAVIWSFTSEAGSDEMVVSKRFGFHGLQLGTFLDFGFGQLEFWWINVKMTIYDCAWIWNGLLNWILSCNWWKLWNGWNGVSENNGWCEDAETDFVPGYELKWDFGFDAPVFHGIWWRQMNCFRWWIWTFTDKVQAVLP